MPLTFDVRITVSSCFQQNRKSHVKIHEDARGEIYTVGITSRPVRSLQEVSMLVFTHLFN